MTNAFTESFTRYTETIETEPDAFGRFFRATIVSDESGDTPWENSDVHGPVSEWRALDSKAPGERVLCRDRGRARFYDVAEASRIARNGWGCVKDGHVHRTPGEERACAIEQDFQRLRAWCNDEWWYVGVVISLWQTVDDEEAPTELADHLASLWGIESDSFDYLTETANELLSEAREDARASRVIVPAGS
jgi:hypothetical protein